VWGWQGGHASSAAIDQDAEVVPAVVLTAAIGAGQLPVGAQELADGAVLLVGDPGPGPGEGGVDLDHVGGQVGMVEVPEDNLLVAVHAAQQGLLEQPRPGKASNTRVGVAPVGAVPGVDPVGS